LLGLVILLGSIIVSTTTLQAKHANPTISFEYIWTAFDAPQKEWFDKDGVYHAIKTPHYGIVTTGDIEGDIYYNGNVVLDFVTFDGKGGGIFEFTGYYEGEAAGFRGKMLFVIEGGIVYGTLNCPGSGAFNGLLFKGTVVAPLGGTTIVELTIWNK
jgi:hypothetical protein